MMVSYTAHFPFPPSLLSTHRVAHRRLTPKQGPVLFRAALHFLTPSISSGTEGACHSSLCGKGPLVYPPSSHTCFAATLAAPQANVLT